MFLCVTLIESATRQVGLDTPSRAQAPAMRVWQRQSTLFSARQLGGRTDGDSQVYGPQLAESAR